MSKELVKKIQASGGCQSGSCYFVKPWGMATTGGCNCLDDYTKNERLTILKYMFDNKIERAYKK